MATTFSINVNSRSPGQYYACIGLLELLGARWDDCHGWFKEDKFFVRTEALIPEPMRTVVSALKQIKVSYVKGMEHYADKLRPVCVLTSVDSCGTVFPVSFQLDWWLGSSGKSNSKGEAIFKDTYEGKAWAGGSYPVRMINDLVAEIKVETETEDILSTVAVMDTGKLMCDPATSARLALDAGFTTNGKPKSISIFTELLAAIGFQFARPVILDKFSSYYLWEYPSHFKIARIASRGLFGGQKRVFEVVVVDKHHKLFGAAQ